MSWSYIPGSLLREMVERERGANSMKASDLTDEAFLAVVHRVSESEKRWAHVDDLVQALGAPRKVILSKARKLIDRGVLNGCGCGCRGDFEMPRGSL